MKNRFLICLLAIFTFLSCNNKQEESTEINSFLQTNYEFNYRTLNNYKGDYYRIIEKIPSRKSEKLNQLDLKFELLISKIDNAIVHKKSNLKSIISESNEILNEIPEIVYNRKDYLLPEFKQPKTDSDELSLRYIRNRLVISMAYAFEYGSRETHWINGLYRVEVNSVISKKNENGIKLTLTSKYAQSMKEKSHLIINKIKFNGREKKVDYELNDNYSFTDIEFDSLQKGTYWSVYL